ncbi:MAG: peptidase M14 [Burkholderiales bacterium]|nr:peptidase M14 [Burkholderiales bacterium]
MRQQTPPKMPPAAGPRTLRSRTCWVAAIALVLSACTSVPLPEWPQPASPQAAPAIPAAPASAPASGQPNTPASVQITPIAAAPLEPASAPYGSAVAARFPDPAVVYSTPGLAPGRTTFTSNAEVRAWLENLAQQSARGPGPRAAVLSLGQSQRGDPIEGLIVTQAPSTDAATVLAAARPTVLLIGQQRGNEPAGCEALLVIARELVQGLLRPVLGQINVIIVPRANPDGAAADQALTADGTDMTRDHLLLNTPEARALAQVARTYHPMVVLDLREYTVAGRYLQKFGAIQGYDALLDYATTANMPEFITKAAEQWFRQPIVAALKAQSLSSEWYYTSSADPADKSVSMGTVQPDTERNVAGLENAVGLLVATRGVGIGRLHIQRRVQTDVIAVSSVLGSTARRANDLIQLRSFVEREVSAKACNEEAVISAAPTPTQRSLVMIDPQTGLDHPVTVEWNSALQLRTLKTRIRPCGYLLSAGSSVAAQRLRLLGVPVMQVTQPGTVLGETYQQAAPAAGAQQSAGDPAADQQPIANVGLLRGVIDAPVGSYYVPVNQPLGSVVLAALEPDTRSSYFSNHLLDSLQSAARVLTVPALALQDMP